MELQDFIKTKKTQKFLHTSYAMIYTKADVLKEVQDRIEKWVAGDEPEKEIKEQVQYVLANFEPYTKEFKSKVKKLMSKWGLK